MSSSFNAENPEPEDVDFSLFLNLDSPRTDQCAHVDLISSEFPPTALNQGTHNAEELANIDHWCPNDVAENWPCQDIFQYEAHHNGDSSGQQTAASSLFAFSEESSVAGDILSDNNPPAEPHNKGKRGKRLPPDAVRVLRSWFYENKDYPYPTDQQRKDLEQQTGLHKSQVFNWFVNARRRKLPKKDATRDINSESLDQKLLSPFERWQHSPPENEPAAATDILRAAENTPFYPFSESMPQYDTLDTAWSSSSATSSFQFGASSISSDNRSHSSASARSQISSGPYQRPPTPLPKMGLSRPRRKARRSANRLAQSTALERRAYQCTFCCDSFRSKYDWQRHEKALHLSIERWNCAPAGGVVEINGLSVCVFCRASSVDADHLETHEYLTCREKMTEHRSFSRKDHLQQHLRLVHRVPYHPSMDEWRVSTAPLLSRCGFCDARFAGWKERVEHVAEHFKNNADMAQWQGDWGFEPHVQCLVENAMPPYLLGLERRTMDPWKASVMEREREHFEHRPLENDKAPEALDRYFSVRQELFTYLQAQIAAGNDPSDQMMQDHARMFAYGNDDPFNQTYADQSGFLVTLRRDVANGLTLGIPINEEVELEGDGLLVPGNYGGLSND
jgi:hypothetical protein